MQFTLFALRQGLRDSGIFTNIGELCIVCSDTLMTAIEAAKLRRGTARSKRKTVE